MTDAEQKGQKFLEYVAKNINRLKKNLKKNITYDENLFEDLFQDSILKVYNTIVKNNKEVQDYEQYFYISSKYNYIIKQNSKREKMKKTVELGDQYNDIEVEEYMEMDVEKIINELKEVITNKFDEDTAKLYFDYMSLKIKGGMSYSKYAELRGIPTSKVSETISKVKQYCKSNKKFLQSNYIME